MTAREAVERIAGLDLDRESARTDVGAELQDVAFLPNWSCAGQPSSACTIVEGDGPHILVIGDSHAWSLFATFARVAQEEDLTLSTAAAAGCPWQRALYDADSPPDGCETFKQDLYERVVPELDPDIVIADVRMPPSQTDEGLRAALTIRASHPHIALVVLSQHVQGRYATELVESSDDAAGIGGERGVGQRVAGQFHRALRARQAGAGFVRRGLALVELGIGRPALHAQFPGAVFRRDRLRHHPGGGAVFGVGLLGLQAQVDLVEHRQGLSRLDPLADLDKALAIVLNAKTQRTSVCNAAESLLVHRGVADRFLPQVVDALQQAGVAIHGDGAFAAWVGKGRTAEDQLVVVRLAASGAPAPKGLEITDGNAVRDPPSLAFAGARAAASWTEVMGATVSTKRLIMRLFDPACVPAQAP